MEQQQQQGPDLWRECAAWMVRCGVLDPTHRVNSPHTDLIEFVQILRDGVLLCKLADRLRKGCIDFREVSLCPQSSQFLCLKNICHFLGACQREFRLPAKDLFEAWELYKAVDFGKVLHTLSELSQSQVANDAGVSGFPRSANEAARVTHEYCNDDIYRNLAEEAEKKEIAEEIYTTGQAQDEEEYGKIYDEIVHRYRGVQTPQSPQRPPSISQPPRVIKPRVDKDFIQEFVPVDKRGYCIKELIETECNYVDALNMLLTKFYTPLNGVFSPEDHAIIFMNLPELAQIHTAFYSELRVAVARLLQPNGNGATAGSSNGVTTNTKLGQVFLRWKHKFVAYSVYCAQLSAAQTRIERLSAESPAIRGSITDCQQAAAAANNNRHFSLQDLLSVPMQRILKYHLLLKELVKKTGPEDEELTSLEGALAAMLDISCYINEVKRDCETLQTIKEVSDSIPDLSMPPGTELKDYGRIQKDGEIRLLAHSDKNAKWKLRFCFVFDRVLLICKALKNNTHSFKMAISLVEYVLKDVAELELPVLVKPLFAKNNQKTAFSWCLVHRQGNNVIQMQAKSEEQKIAWISAFQAAAENTLPAAAKEGEHDFVFRSFAQATECAQCDLLLRGLFFQGYGCSQCQAAVHKSCLRSVAPCAARRHSSSTLPAPLKRAQSTVGQRFRTIKAFLGNNGGPDYLCFNVGDTLEVLSTTTGADGWLRGRVTDGQAAGRVGLFPADCIDGATPLGSAAVRRAETFSGGQGQRSIEHHRQTSTISNASTASTTLPPPPPPATNYLNLDEMSAFPWFMGTIGREDAEHELAGMADGVFLVRYSEKQARYAISLCYKREVKHVKIEQDGALYFLDESQMFPSIVLIFHLNQLQELVTYYEEHNLHESFAALDTCLGTPLPHAFITYASIEHEYEATADNLLSLPKGARVMVLSKQGQDKGWWKGKIGPKIGYFPLAYVKELRPPETADAAKPAASQFV